MATFATRLAQLRQEKKMSQQDLADRLKISRSAVGMYEQGRRGPDFDILDDVAELFDVDFNYMLGKTDVRGQYPKSAPKVTIKTKGKKTLVSIARSTPYKPVRTQKQPEHDQVMQAYTEASPEIQAAVRRVLGINR